jgi:hypothetical protein
MMEHDGRTIVCNDCESVPQLYETPYSETVQYVVACDCTARAIDVSACVSDSSLVEPITGKWTNFDGDNPNI